jgi:hypothetical protein
MSFLEKLDYVLTAAYTLLKGSTDTALREKIVATVVGLVTGTGINDVYNSGLMDPEWLKEATPGQIVGTLLEIFLKKVEEASVFGMAKAAAGQALELIRGLGPVVKLKERIEKSSSFDDLNRIALDLSRFVGKQIVDGLAFGLAAALAPLVGAIEGAALEAVEGAAARMGSSLPSSGNCCSRGASRDEKHVQTFGSAHCKAR